eukprot:4202330-Prymnesium_polylepis.1
MACRQRGPGEPSPSAAATPCSTSVGGSPVNVSSVSTSSRTASTREPPAPLVRWCAAWVLPTATAS